MSLSESLLLAPTFHAIVSRNVHGAHKGDLTIFSELDEAISAVGARERDRRRRIARLESSRLDMTHPPTAFRIDLLERRPKLLPRVVLDPAASNAVDAELGPYRRSFAETLIDEARDRLYYG